MAEPDNLAFLLGRIAVGDKRAMKALYDSVGPDLHRFIQTRLRDPHEAADALQETMLDVWRQAGHFEGRASARTWIYSIARNKAVDRVRKTNTVVAEPDETIPDDAPSPHMVVEALQDAQALRQCIGALSQAHRAAIQLAYFQDVPYPQIAEIENCSVGTIKTRVHHAKRLLMHCLTRAAGKSAGPSTSPDGP